MLEPCLQKPALIGNRVLKNNLMNRHAVLLRPDPARVVLRPYVVYTCGAIRHNNQIILPYAVSDTLCRFASIEIGKLVNSMDG